MVMIWPKTGTRDGDQTFAKARDDGKFGWVHASPHEQDEVLVPRLPERRHLLPERLQRGLVVQVLHVQDLDGHVPVPAAFVH